MNNATGTRCSCGRATQLRLTGKTGTRAVIVCGKCDHFTSWPNIKRRLKK